MFGLKNKNSKAKKFLNKEDFQAENIPIHTMQRDLESLNHPEKKDMEVQESADRPIDGSSRNPAPSPFLERNFAPQIPKRDPVRIGEKDFSEQVPSSASGATPVPRSVPPSDPVSPEPDFKKELFTSPSDPSSWSKDIVNNNEGAERKKKLIIALVLITLFTATAAGGYYFWNSQRNAQSDDQASPEIIPEEETSSVSEAKKNPGEEPAVSKFSLTERNFFMLDLGGAAPVSFQELVKKYFNDIVNSNISYPIEFTVIDAGNSLVFFETFAREIGIHFSPELMSALEEDFNLYIYNDSGDPGVGLSLKIRKGLVPEEILLREEDNLSEEIKSLFPVSPYIIEKGKSFSTSEYDSDKWGKIGVRFQNIDSQRNLSVDYALVDTGTKMLFIGTTRNTLRTILESAKLGSLPE